MKNNRSFEYAAFLDEPTYFNLVSTVKDDNPTCIVGSNLSSFFVLSADGILMEMELIPANTLPLIKPMIVGEKNHLGMPIFSPEDLEQSSKQLPEIFFDDNSAISLIKFEHKSSVDSVYIYRNLRFFINENKLSALEISGTIRERDDEKQIQWLKKHGIVDEW